MIALLEEGLRAGALGLSSGLFTPPGSFAQPDELHALCAAQAVGMEVPKKTMDKAIFYIRECQDLQGNGGFRYQRQRGPSGFARSAESAAGIGM